MDARERQCLHVAEEAQARIIEAIARMSPEELAGSAFAQAGLTDGAAIVEDCLRNDGIGLGFDHLRYMVEETGIPLSDESARFMRDTVAFLGLGPYGAPSP